MLVPFKNDSGQTIPGWAVMRSTGTAVVANQVVLKMGQPNGTLERCYYLNGPCAVQAGQYGVTAGAWPSGFPIYAQYDGGSGSGSTTPAYGQSWGAQASSWVLAPNRPGFTILGNTMGDGEDEGPKRVVVRPEIVSEVYGKLSADLKYQGTDVVVNVYVGKPGGKETDGGLTVKANDGLLESGEKLDSGSKVVCRWLNGCWYVIAVGKCPSQDHSS